MENVCVNRRTSISFRSYVPSPVFVNVRSCTRLWKSASYRNGARRI
uniref:Uncharacterized protein n=1 Tax=Anguilla anguilla TaxID=7936 RepID=A0A0E9XFK0_ANGAN